MAAAILTSIHVGRPATYGDPAAARAEDRPWTTSFFKSPVVGPVRLSRTNLDGDEQADLRFHGGIDKAVLAYSEVHYERWRDILDLPEIGPGGFGENLTVSPWSEEDVCLGDVWTIGAVRLQISQPRQPCFKLGRRWNKSELVKLTALSGWTGWYLRVLEEGMLTTGDEIQLASRIHPDWTIARANRALFHKDFPLAEAEELAKLPELADAWREDLLGRIGTRVQ